jgi:stringent starvation protein B
VAALKTHLLRAVYDWALENGFTPQIVVDSKAEGVRVPAGHADEAGRVVLNIHPRALQGFSFDDSWIRFTARFGGTPYGVEVPLAAVLAIYARENGQGISFPSGGAEQNGGHEPPESGPGGGTTRKRPGLRVVK